MQESLLPHKVNEVTFIKYKDAVTLATEESIKEHNNIVILGQDLTAWGGASGVLKKFAHIPPGVYDTPISEAATVNIAVGLAMSGFRPIVEFTFMDFVLHAMDAIINQAAKMNAISDGQFSSPVIFRVVINSARGYGATHSQSLESLFTKVPGLEVVYPATARDAYWLMKAALKSSKPVVFVEHKLLHENESEITKNPATWGTAQILKEGTKATLVTYGRMCTLALAATNDVNGIEIIDLRSLSPIDTQTIIRSVRKTGRLLLLEEGYGTISAEVAVIVAEHAFEHLKRPIVRLHSKFEVIPADKESEDAIFPTTNEVFTAVKKLI